MMDIKLNSVYIPEMQTQVKVANKKELSDYIFEYIKANLDQLAELKKYLNSEHKLEITKITKKNGKERENVLADS